MKIPYSLLYAGLFFLLTNIGFSQERTYRKYATQAVHQRLLQEDSTMAQRQSDMENHIRQFAQNPVIQADTISLIFHCLQSPGHPAMSSNQILWQLQQLNTHFATPNMATEDYYNETLNDYLQLATDPQLVFCLADLSASGVDAIEHLSTNTTVWNSNDDIKFSETGGMNSYHPQQYLNIWVGTLDNIAGYATSPAAPAEVDGIVIDYRYLTGELSSYTEGKTLTHLIGNYLGLKDLWDETHWCGDDGVRDTPVHNAPNYTVPDSPMNRHVSLCPNVPQEMLFNFMDATDDEHQRMFTHGQVMRMKAVLAADGLRAALKTGINVCPPVAPLLEAEQTAFESTSNTQNKLLLYPNPSQQELNIQLFTEQAGTGFISVFNSVGIEIHQEITPITKGMQVFHIEIADWAKGVYTLQIRWNGQQVSQPFIR